MIALAIILLWWSGGLQPAEIVIGENVRVSREESPYVEPFIASHPRIAQRLVGVATRFSASGPTIPVVFVSSDGGRTWQEKALTAETLSHAVDCWVTFAENGTAYASVLIIEPGNSRTKIAIFRSNDGGESWARVSTIAAQRSFDRPSLIARGNDVLVAAEYAGAIALLHSRDRGRTFGPVRKYRPSDNVQHNAMNPMLRGADVFVPFVDFGETLQSSRVGMIRTNDFGRTWSRPAVIADVPRRFPGLAHFAASKEGFVAAFASGTAESRSISVVHSSDGLRWSEPAVVSNRGAQAFRPAIAVSSLGHVGVTWIEVADGCARLWFTVSTNGARSFAKPVPVSDEYSCADNPPNRDAFQKWEHGGDYFGLTAQEETFVAMWTDARGGTFQIYAARVAPSLQ